MMTFQVLAKAVERFYLFKRAPFDNAQDNSQDLLDTFFRHRLHRFSQIF